MLGNNLIEVFENSVKKQGEKICFRFVENGKWTTLNWKEVQHQVKQIAGGLNKLGIQKGDRVAILSKTRYEWTLADLGVMAAGGVVVPIYESNIPEQVEFILNNSESKIVFVENQMQYDKVRGIQDQVPSLTHVVSFTDLKTRTRDGVYTLEELQILGADQGEHVYHKFLKEIRPEDEATFVYTSGTTGNPKGAVLTHVNFLSELEAGIDVFPFEEHYESLIFLPLAHILARVVQFFQLSAGFIQAYAESIDKILDNISTVRPHFMASVPRIFEKIHTRTLQGVETGSPLKKKIFKWALEAGMQKSDCLLKDQDVPATLELKNKIAHQLVFKKLHEKLGGRIQFFISGGAPLSQEVAKFFHAFGFLILEGYGLTETTAAITINRPEKIKIGSVGKVIPRCQIKIAEDGEILAKGDMVFQGYYKNPEATQEAFTEDGWFRTGDIGEIDADGFLKITDRKKDLIITAAGKNIAPQNIENLIKSDPYISQCVVHGDRRKFLSALLTLDRDEVEKFAKENRIHYSVYDDLVKSDKVTLFIKQRLDALNKRLAKYETIKRFAILPADFSVESGELTPTLKVKRKIVNERYKDIFDGFYRE